ncbi:MAG: hypothetical protein BGO98_17945 [Myxococcales bacterium 68-20]|nr:MAG: hypothetical protein BGO98_17945 [Myxococcales bacterium 68-20]
MRSRASLPYVAPIPILALSLVALGACSGDESSSSMEPEAPGSTDRGSPEHASETGDESVIEAETDTADAGEGDAGAGDAGKAACPRVRIAVPPGNSVNVRQMPNTDASIVATLPNNSIVTVAQRTTGEVVSGNTEWFEISTNSKKGFIAAAFAKCTTAMPPVLKAPKEYHLPLECKSTARVSQGNNGSTSHFGKARYAFDFALPVNTPLAAMADGVVTYLFAETGPGDPCYNGGPSSCFPYANYVVLRHGDGSASIYKHLNKVHVSLGEFVPSGKAVGLSGSTGYSTGPHAHVMRQQDCGAATSCQSISVKFADVPGSGVPSAGQTVTSKNGCP